MKTSLSSSLFTGAALSALLAFAVPAAAQDATLPPGQPSQQPGQEAANGSGAAPATEAQPSEKPQPGPGVPFVKELSGDWEVRCVANEAGAETCQLFQLMRNEDDHPVAEVSLFRTPKGGKAVAAATIIAPLETLLTRNISISVDGARPFVYPFSFCTKVGCFARLGLTAAEVNAFKRGRSAKVTMYHFSQPNQPVTVTMSLTGFTAGLEKASEINPN